MKTPTRTLITIAGTYSVRGASLEEEEGGKGPGFLASVLRPDDADKSPHDVHLAATEADAWEWCRRDAAYVERMQSPPLWWDDASYARYQAGDYLSNREE